MESMVFLPPNHSKKSLHELYNSIQADESLHVVRTTFLNIFEKYFPYVRVSLRARGLCDICIVWVDHLELAAKTREIYRASLAEARESSKYLLPLRLKSTTLSYDYAKQLSIPVFAEQTTNEWFAQKKGYVVNIFGIVDEGRG